MGWGSCSLGAWGPTWRATEAPPSHEDTVVPSGRLRDPPPQDCLLVLKCFSWKAPVTRSGSQDCSLVLKCFSWKVPVTPLRVPGLKLVSWPRLVSGGGTVTPPRVWEGLPDHFHLLHLVHSVHLAFIQEEFTEHKINHAEVCNSMVFDTQCHATITFV